MVQIALPRPAGHGKSWAKHVTSFDRSKHGGYAFNGRFLSINHGTVELPEGSVVIIFSQEPTPQAHLYKMRGAGWDTIASANGVHWADQLKPHVSQLVPEGTEKQAAAMGRPTRQAAPIPMPGTPAQANTNAEFEALKYAVGKLFEAAGEGPREIAADLTRPEEHRHLAEVFYAIMTGTELPARI